MKESDEENACQTGKRRKEEFITYLILPGYRVTNLPADKRLWPKKDEKAKILGLTKKRKIIIWNTTNR